MIDYVQIGSYALDKEVAKAIVITLLLTTIVLVYYYLKIIESKVNLDSLLYTPEASSADSHNDLEDSSLPILDCSSNDYMQLKFCEESCSVIESGTGKVVGKFQKGSQNCRLMRCLFDNPDQYLSELELVEKTQPDRPENFYLRKAICNLKIDKQIKDKMFSWENNHIKLNLIIPV